MARVALLGALDPFASTALPETRELTPLELGGSAVIAKFNVDGSLLAVGCRDGRVILCDFMTRNVIRNMTAHFLPITSIGWSPCNKRMFSTSADWSLIIWDILNGTVHKKFYFNCPILHAQIHPKDKNVFLVCPLIDPVCILDIRTGERKKLIQSGGSMGAAEFSPNGEFLVFGNSKGLISVIDSKSYKVQRTFQVKGGASVKSIRFDRSGNHIVINSSDKMLRVYSRNENGSWEGTNEIIDSINRLQWKCACFSSDSDYVFAGTAERAAHNIYYWMREYRDIAGTLEGPKEGVLYIDWHPKQSILLSVSTSGAIYVWKPNTVIHWSAFAPDFKELEENITYTEREDELDIVSDAEESDDMSDEEERVDVVNLSDDEGSYVLPSVPDTDTGIPDFFQDIMGVVPQ